MAIILKNSTVAAKVPLTSDLVNGELAVNSEDNKLYIKNATSGLVVEVGAGGGIALTDLSATGSLTYTNTTGVFDFTERTKSEIDTLILKGLANGYATLDGAGTIPQAQLGAIAITDTFVVANQAAMLALTAQTGDVAVRTDENKSYILKGTDPSVLGDWQELLSPTGAVTSVDGNTGAVTAAQLLTSINTVDGSGSGLDADLLDGLDSLAFLQKSGGTMTGNTIHNDNVHSFWGTGNDLDIYHSGSNTAIFNKTGTLFIEDQVNSGLVSLRTWNSAGAIKDGIIIGGATPDVKLYYDGVQVMSTVLNGINLADNKHAYFGTGNDLDIFHDGTNSFLDVKSGGFVIRNSSNSGLTAYYNKDSGGLNRQVMQTGGATPDVKLYYGGVEEFSTISGGFASPTFSTTGASNGMQYGGAAISTSRSVTSTATHTEFYNPNGLVGRITTNALATAYLTTSDYRLKENDVPISDAITRIKALRPIRFNFKADPLVTVDGFLAHEAQAQVPECVVGEKDEMAPAVLAVDSLTYTSVATGAPADLITITHLVAGNDTVLSTTVTGNDIVINLATDSNGDSTSTDLEVVTLLEADTNVTALISVSSYNNENIPGAQVTTNLTGGNNPVMQGIDQGKIVPLLTAALKESIAKNEALVLLLVTNNIITQAEADAL